MTEHPKTFEPIGQGAPAPARLEWQLIYSAPRQGVFDVWAKRWDSKTDGFIYRRFTDCYWRSTYIHGLPKEWRATHWAPILSAPAS